MNASLLLLADSRLPAGAHAHSGGLEAAIEMGVVTGMADLEGFLRGRLATAGLTSAALAAAACAHAAEAAPGHGARAARGAGEARMGAAAPQPPSAFAVDAAFTTVNRPGWRDGWTALAAEAAARTPSPAQRRAACAQGRSLLRAGRAAWPHPVLDSLAASLAGDQLHHPIVLGACAHAAGGAPLDAAAIAATAAITGPASAGIRLLGLDPLATNALLARLSPAVDSVAAAAVAAAASAAAAGPTAAGATDDVGAAACRAPRTSRWSGLPAPASPGLDLLAERHALQEVALFES